MRAWTTTRAMPEGRARAIIGALVVAGCLAFVAFGMAGDLDRVELEAVSWPFIARAAGVLLVVYVVRAVAFGVLVRAMDGTVPVFDAAAVFVVSQLGRYIPGKVWQVAGAGYFASRVGISATVAVVGTAYYVVIQNLVGGLIGIGVIVRTASASDTVDPIAPLLVIGALVIAFASSPAFPWLLGWMGRRLGKDLEVRRIPMWAVLVTVGSSLCVWCLFGFAVVDVFRGALPGSPPPDLGDSIVNMAAASVAGLAVLIVPSGLGVREAVFVAAFSGQYTVTESGVVALVLRLLMSGMELLLAVLGLLRVGRGVEAPEQDESP